eukprot:2332789-Rhodomonas_salina.1
MKIEIAILDFKFAVQEWGSRRMFIQVFGRGYVLVLVKVLVSQSPTLVTGTAQQFAVDSEVLPGGGSRCSPSSPGCSEEL